MLLRKFNRVKRQTLAHSHGGWCPRCDQAIIARGQKCPRCSYREGKTTMPHNALKRNFFDLPV